MSNSIQQVLRVLSMIVLAVLMGIAGCSRGAGTENPGDALARLAGRMANENDLQKVLFEDLDGDGSREVILVFGQRELLDFDVYYRGDGEWLQTPMLNDRGNPREFKGARLDSIRDLDSDRRCEIRVSSRLYDGNSLVKELHWSPAGYEVIGQHTVIAREQRISQARPPAKKPSASAVTPAVEKPPEKPKPKPYRPLTPQTGIYLVRKGDTVYGLARLLGVPGEELESINDNQLARRGLRIGQRINVPVPGRENTSFSVRIDKQDHVVGSGESLTSIAEKYGVRLRELMSWNPNLPEDGKIKVGQILKIHHAVVDIKQ